MAGQPGDDDGIFMSSSEDFSGLTKTIIIK